MAEKRILVRSRMASLLLVAIICLSFTGAFAGDFWGYYFRFYVVDSQSETPIENARVVVRWSYEDGRKGQDSALTDSEGYATVWIGDAQLEDFESDRKEIHISHVNYRVFKNWATMNDLTFIDTEGTTAYREDRKYHGMDVHCPHCSTDGRGFHHPNGEVDNDGYWFGLLVYMDRLPERGR